MTTAHVQQRLRPTRIGFLVPPNDMSLLNQIFSINTCLWGGKYNPIIPVFSKRPSWWDRHGLRYGTPKQIIDGYLDYFEPDILVEMRPGLASGLGYNEERVIGIERLVPPPGRWDGEFGKTIGLNVFSLYRHLYEREFQYAKRDPEKVIRVKTAGPSLSGLAGCLFGSFPSSGTFHQLEETFDRVFAPEIIGLEPQTAFELIQNNWRNPLHITHHGLAVRYEGYHGPGLFVLDGTKPSDLIDYWNLRAGVAPVVPIPIQFLEQLAPFAQQFISQNYRPLPNNRNGVMIRTVVMFARSIATEAIEPIFDAHFRVDIDGANLRQDWYPAIWRSNSELVSSPTRPQIEAATSSHSLPMDGEKPTLQFDALKPPFAEDNWSEARWANVLKITDWSFSDRFATVYPDDYRDPKRPNFGGGFGNYLSTSEGFVELARYSGARHLLQLETNVSAITNWLSDRSIGSRLSGSGRATQQIIETLGGLRGVSALANPEVVNLLNSISRKPLTKSMEHHQFRNRINRAVKGSLWNQDAGSTLINQNAVEIGLEVCCDKCGSWSWYSLAGLDLDLQCALCLKAFRFPAIDPGASDRARWAYRLIGPFAQPDYAHGGYASALAIRFFAKVLDAFDHSALTWCAGQELTLPSGQSVEADFLLWYRRARTFTGPAHTEIVLGEAKSFGKDRFVEDDIQRMRVLAEIFPGATLVFATMKTGDQLSSEEIRRLSSLAKWGRHYDRSSQRSRGPVVILTAKELFADYSLADAWEKAGGRHAELIAPAYIRPENLRILADLTQQLYLGLEPYHSSLERQLERRRRPG